MISFDAPDCFYNYSRCTPQHPGRTHWPRHGRQEAAKTTGTSSGGAEATKHLTGYSAHILPLLVLKATPYMYQNTHLM